MKNILMLICLLTLFGAGFGCSKDTIEPTPKPLTSEIIFSEDGCTFNLFQILTITGITNAKDITNAQLFINEVLVLESPLVPIEYIIEAGTYPRGVYKVLLNIIYNEEIVTTSSKNFIFEDFNIEPQAIILEPVDNTEFEFDDNIIIKGDGADTDGTIEKVILKIDNKPIPIITSVPFEYTIPKEGRIPGIHTIGLKVQDNNGRTNETEISFLIKERPTEFVDSRDGNVYGIVYIGDQKWFSNNLAYLPKVAGPAVTSKTEAYYHVYGYNGTDVDAAKATDSYKTRGVLYNWLAAAGDMNLSPELIPSGIQGPCPVGWHMPNLAEWQVLFQYIRDQIPASEAVEDMEWGETVFLYNVSGHLRSKGDWPLDEEAEYGRFPQLKDSGKDTYGFKSQVTGFVNQPPVGGGRFYKGPDAGGDVATYWTPAYDAVTFPNSPGGVSIIMTNVKYEPTISRISDIRRAYSIRCIMD